MKKNFVEGNQLVLRFDFAKMFLAAEKEEEKASIVVSLQDITEHIQATEALRKSEEDYRSIFENAMEGIFQSTPDGKFLRVNPAMAQIYGYASPEEMIAKVSDIKQDIYVNPNRCEEWKRLLQENGSAIGFEAEEYRKDGSTIQTLSSTRTVRDASGAILYYEGMLEDITERKQAEEALQRSTEQLRELSNRLSETLEAERRSIARELHDEIGQVITAIKINLEGLLLAPVPETMRPLIKNSIRSTDRAIEEVRALSLGLRPSLLDDFGLQAAVEWYLEHQVKKVGISAQLQSNLGERRFPTSLETTAFRVAQSALNNTLHHARARCAKVHLHLTPDTAKDKLPELEVSVSDDGVGFDVEFELEQARRGKSMGLLSIQERVRLIGGTVTIQSAPGRGTKIYARLPIKEET